MGGDQDLNLLSIAAGEDFGLFVVLARTALKFPVTFLLQEGLHQRGRKGSTKGVRAGQAKLQKIGLRGGDR